MTILDRYIARLYLVNIVVLMVILCSFVVVIDVSLNLDRFTRAAANHFMAEGIDDPGFLRRWSVTVIYIADLWWPRLAQLFNFILGFVLVAAMGFTCSQLSRHRELIAVLAAGQSLRRIARPILVVGLGLICVQLANQELVIPRVAALLARDHGDAGNHQLGTDSVPLTADGQHKLFRADAFDADEATLRGVTIWERSDAGLPERVIRAELARWDGRGWALTGGLAFDRRPSASSRASRGVSVERVETGLSPIDLAINRYRQFRNAVSFRQAGRVLGREELLSDPQRDRWVRIRWGRFAAVLSTLLTLVIALPFYLTREPKGMVAQSLRCAPITVTALMIGALGSSAGVPGLPALVGVFVPVLLLGPIAVGFWGTIKS